MPQMEKYEFEDLKKQFEEAQQKMGHVNIALAGKTGVGKSTLLNAIFKENLAETGIGRPVTQHSQEYTKEGFPVSILDTKGFELDGFDIILKELKKAINARKTGDPKTHIHVLWYCIRNGENRIEPAEINFIQELSKEIPVIVVLTQGFPKNQKFYDAIKADAADARNVIRVLAQDMVEDGDVLKKSYGLDELTNATYDLIPEAFQSAFASAQKINMDLKQKAARKAIAVSALAASAACVVPLPFADATALCPIQIEMLASISHIMGMELSKSFIATLVSSAIGVSGATYLGRTIVTNILKCIPGAGTILGASVGAATAAALTTAMGEAYLGALSFVLSTTDNPDPAYIAQIFKSMLKKEKIEPVN